MDEVLADVDYRTVVYAEPGDQDENENFARISQLGLRRGFEHPSNVFAKRAFYLYTNPKFRVHPATASWFKDDS